MVDFERDMEVVYLPLAGHGKYRSVGKINRVHYQGATKTDLTVVLTDGNELTADSTKFRLLDDILFEVASIKPEKTERTGKIKVYTLTEAREFVTKVYEKARGVIVGQEHALKQIITELLEYALNPKKTEPFLIVGKTGTGKTSSVRAVCEIMEIAFAKVVITDLSPATYKGASLQTAVYQAIETIEETPGVLFFDEVDKLQARREVFQMLEAELLKVLEPGAELVAEVGGKIVRGSITQKIVLAGTFSREKYTISNPFTIDLLISSGFSPEFAGRVGRAITLNDLTTEDFRRMLDLERPLPFVREATTELLDIGIDLVVEPEAIEILAERAVRSKLGARALVTGFRTVVSKLKQNAFFGDLPTHGSGGLVEMRLSRHTVESALPRRNLRAT